MTPDGREPLLRPHWPRYEARSSTVGRRVVWGVYDAQMASWPGERDGMRWPQGCKDQAAVEAFVQALNSVETPPGAVVLSRKSRARARAAQTGEV